jgi:hypothetical protein
MILYPGGAMMERRMAETPVPAHLGQVHGSVIFFAFIAPLVG